MPLTVDPATFTAVGVPSLVRLQSRASASVARDAVDPMQALRAD